MRFIRVSVLRRDSLLIFAVCTEKCNLVVEADPEAAVPFKEKMDSFFREAAEELANEQEALLDAKNKFKAVMQFYQYTPKGSNLDAADPNAFFILWLGFCKDFKVRLFYFQSNEET